jgi:ADP-ribose pyrophosphatase YjhB (NUDIX family)
MMSPAAKARVASLMRRFRPLVWMLRLATRVLGPRQPVGAVGAIFNDAGQVLLVEHVFRTDFPWGLPGGWIERGEDPENAVKREVAEELHLDIEVKSLLLSAQIPVLPTSGHPKHMGLAYYCRLVGGEVATAPFEVLSIEWCDPRRIPHEMAPFQRRAAELGLEMFQQEGDARIQRRLSTA